jgi:hypothetical protein
MAGKKKVDDVFKELREKRGGPRANSDGITKDEVTAVLEQLGLANEDRRDAVYALLDDDLDSLLAVEHKFADGATIAQIGCHVGILQRGQGKLDREGRDHWIKPLREPGAIEKVTWVPDAGEFVAGHITPKSPYSAYRLDEDFKKVLAAGEDKRQKQVTAWAAKDAVRERLTLQAKAAEAAKERYGGGQGALIEGVKGSFAPAHLPEFELVYVDSDDGDRVTDDEKAKLAAIGLTLGLAESYPDLIYYRKSDHSIWCIEAVTSDGEVDETKLRSIENTCAKAKLNLAGLTTAYATYKDFAQRQSKHRNIAAGTYVWIEKDAAKHWLASAPPKRAKEALALAPE